MLAIAAKKYNIPLIVLTRGFCLSNRIILGQESLLDHVNPSEIFGENLNSLDAS